MVATYVPHLKLSFGGNLGGVPTEIWSNTIRFYSLNYEPLRPVLEEANNALEVPLINWFTAQKSHIADSAQITYSKLNWVLANGKQRDLDTVLNDFATTPRGFESSDRPPFYQTQAITLRTNRARGRAHAGRIYPPVVVFRPSEAFSPYTSAAMATDAADSFITFLRAARTAMGQVFSATGGPVPDPAVISPGNTDGPVAAIWAPILTAVCDRVPDVQHRRTKQIPRAEGGTATLNV